MGSHHRQFQTILLVGILQEIFDVTMETFICLIILR